MVEEVEELSAKLEAHPFRLTENGSLEYGEVKVHDTFLTKGGIDARFVAKDKGIGLRETGSVEPFIQSGFGAAREFRLAARDAIGARACAKCLGCVRGEELQRETVTTSITKRGVTVLIAAASAVGSPSVRTTRVDMKVANMYCWYGIYTSPFAGNS